MIGYLKKLSNVIAKTQLALLDTFDTISLEQLNATANFLNRKDRKYVFNISKLPDILEELTKDYFILQIWANKVFNYDNVYMDTENLNFYYRHQHGIKPRIKVRSRLYKESNLCYFEVKQKDKNNITRKFRYQRNPKDHGIITKNAKQFFEWVYQTLCNKKAPQLMPVVRTTYSRITLVHKKSEERITIDFNLKSELLLENNKTKIDFGDIVIFESKSFSKKPPSKKILKKYWIKRIKRCSKYALSLAFGGAVEEYSRFEETMNFLKKTWKINILKVQTENPTIKKVCECEKVK